MTPTAQTTKTVQRTVFDLNKFDDVLLKKEVTLPTRPATLEEALIAVGNDSTKLLNVIYEGLVADSVAAAQKDIAGFKVVDEDGNLTSEDYTGKFADEEKGKLINGAVLNIAKMLGFEKSLSPEKKRELKAQATEFIRSNPAMLASIQG